MMNNLSISDTHRKMIVHILHTANWLDSKISTVLKKIGITHVQYNILKVLEVAHPEPISVGKVKEGILFANSDMTRLMDRLVDKGLMVRNICQENRRKINVVITADGLKLLQIVNPKIAVALDGYYASKINEEEAKWIASKLKEIRN